MDNLFKKLNYKDQQDIYILNAPESFHPVLNSMESECNIHRELNGSKILFSLIFVLSCDEIKEMAGSLKGKFGDDPVVWFAYPKKSSKKYNTDISRDSGWQPLGDLGFEPVRQVAIDEDWSALRFRNSDYIKTMKRNPGMLISEKGKKKRL